MKSSSNLPYKVSANDSAWQDDPALGPELGAQYARLRAQVLGKKRKPLDELNKFISAYPQLPHFRYILSEYQSGHEQNAGYEDLRDEIATEFPDYIFSRLHRVIAAVEDVNSEELWDQLGEQKELHLLYPDRKVFHEMEALAYELAVMQGMIIDGNLKEADNRLQRMYQINAGHLYTDVATQLYMIAEVAEISGNDSLAGGWPEEGEELDENGYLFDDEEEPADPEWYLGEYDPEAADAIRNKMRILSGIQKVEPPIFELPEIQNLYGPGPNPGSEVISKLLSADRATLIRDLITLLFDCIDRFEYHRTQEESDEFIALHALFLLAEMEAEESLYPPILDFFAMPAEVLEFWLGDIMLMDVWEVLYRTGRHRLGDLIAFAQDESNYTMARVLVPEMLTNWGLHDPKAREEVIGGLKTLLNYSPSGAHPVSIAQQQFLSMVVSFCGPLRALELFPDISRLYAQGLVDEEICKPLKKVKIELQSPLGRSPESASLWKLKGDYMARIRRFEEVLM